MKLLKRTVFTIVLIVIAAIFLFISFIIYQEEIRKKEIYRETNPDGDCVFVLYQVGQPDFPFGGVKAEIRLLNANGKTVDKESFNIHTDGGQLNQFYIEEVRWSDATVEFICNQADGLDAVTYVLELK